MACDAQPALQAGGKMRTGRLEAFSDGVIAIIITIMVLEMKVPHGDSPNDLLPVLPVFLTYVLSFVYVGIYWNNHHHLLHATSTVTGAILWANLHLLFWLSLFPFATGWMGENHFSVLPAPASNHPLARTGLDFEKSGWPRLEGQAVAYVVYRCDYCRLTFVVDR